jgi:hypothetical protein
MSQTEIDVIIARFEDFKEAITKQLDKIEIKFDHKCDNCAHVPLIKERLKSQWTHITGIWTVIGAFAAYLLLGR